MNMRIFVPRDTGAIACGADAVAEAIRAEAGKRAAGEYYAPALFSERTRALVRLLQRLP